MYASYLCSPLPRVPVGARAEEIRTSQPVPPALGKMRLEKLELKYKQWNQWTNEIFHNKQLSVRTLWLFPNKYIIGDNIPNIAIFIFLGVTHTWRPVKFLIFLTHSPSKTIDLLFLNKRMLNPPPPTPTNWTSYVYGPLYSLSRLFLEYLVTRALNSNFYSIDTRDNRFCVRVGVREKDRARLLKRPGLWYQHYIKDK